MTQPSSSPPDDRVAPWRLWLFRAIAAYLRHAPEHPGRWRLIEPAVAMAPLLRTVEGSTIIRISEGFRLRVDGSSQTGRMLYATGEYERESTNIIKRLLKPGDTMIDVGANVGYFAILGARAVGSAGRVVAFEPAERVRAQLVANLQLNELENVTVRGEALSAAAGVASFFSGPDNDTGLASLRPLEHSREIRVVQARFDDLWEPSQRVALVKMDVEGAELAALEGMSDTLSRDLPDLLIEVTDAYLRGLGASAEALCAFLWKKGYSMYQIGPGNALPHIDGPDALARCPGQFNALFTVKTNLNQRLT